MITRFRLFESEIVNQEKSPESVYKKNSNITSLDGVPLTLEDVEKIFDADPSVNKSYVVWMIVKLFKNSERHFFYENLYKATEYLETFEKIKHKIKNERDKNIFNISSLPQLSRIIRPFEERVENLLSQSQKQNPTELPEEIKSKLSTKLVYEDEEWQIIIPLSRESSCVLGDNTEWCTAKEGGSMYDTYVNNGPLYIFRRKEKDESGRVIYIPMYQLHLHGGSERIKLPQFMDVSDDPSNPTEFFDNNPKLKDAMIEFWKNNSDKYLKTKVNPLSCILNARNKDKWDGVLLMVLESGLDVNYTTEITPNSAFFDSIESLDVKTIELLIRYGANVKSKNQNGETPMIKAIQSDNSFSRPDDNIVLRICKLLHEKGADASGTNSDGYSSTLIEAFVRDYYNTVFFILDLEGYNPNAEESPYGKNIISFLINSKISERPDGLALKDIDYILSKLIEKGLDINSIVGSKVIKRNALHTLSILSENDDSKVDIAELFLQKGANPWIKDNSSHISEESKDLYPIELPMGRPKNPKMTSLLSEWMIKLNPNGEIPNV